MPQNNDRDEKSSFIIVDAQSVKNIDTAENKGMEKLRKKAQYQLSYGYFCFCCFACEKTLSRLLDKINYHRVHKEHREGSYALFS